MCSGLRNLRSCVLSFEDLVQAKERGTFDSAHKRNFDFKRFDMIADTTRQIAKQVLSQQQVEQSDLLYLQEQRKAGPVGYSNKTRGTCDDIRRVLPASPSFEIAHVAQTRVAKGKYLSREHQYMSEWMGGKYIRGLVDRVTGSTTSQRACLEQKARRTQTPH